MAIDKRILTLRLTVSDAHAVLRALATANDAIMRDGKTGDVAQNTWVAERLLRFVEEGAPDGK